MTLREFIFRLSLFLTAMELCMETMFYRKGHIITDTDGNVVFEGTFRDGKTEYASINAAKRQSRKLQAQHGKGCVRKR